MAKGDLNSQILNAACEEKLDKVSLKNFCKRSGMRSGMQVRSPIRNGDKHSCNLIERVILRKLPVDELLLESNSGEYILNETASLIVLRFRDIFTNEHGPSFSISNTDELKEFMEDDEKVSPSPNPRNAGQKLKRKQCTFGISYSFGKQKSAGITSEVSEWPRAVQQALKITKMMATQLGYKGELYNGVHVNYYPDGSSGMGIHTDNESCLMKRMPIFSYTLLPQNSKARAFSIYKCTDCDDVLRKDEKLIVNKRKRKDPPVKIAEINCHHGDILIMCGTMQEDFLHGLEVARPTAIYKKSSRLNLTVRAFDATYCNEK